MSLAPGAVGISQAFNVASLLEATDAATGGTLLGRQQQLMTAWNIVLASVLVAEAFGRSAGERLIEQSSGRARKLQGEARA